MLYDADKDFISAVMYIKEFPFSRCAYTKNDSSMSLIETWQNMILNLSEVDKPGIQPCDLTAMPFTLFKVAALKKLSLPMFEDYMGVPPDSTFCEKCLSEGIQPYVHMGIHLNHGDVTPDNRMLLFNMEGRDIMRHKKLPESHPLYAKLLDLFGEDGNKDIDKIKGYKEELVPC